MMDKAVQIAMKMGALRESMAASIELMNELIALTGVDPAIPVSIELPTGEAEPKASIYVKEVMPPPQISSDELRAVLAKKAGNGFTAEIKALIEKFGAAKFSELSESHYAAVLAEAEQFT